MKKHKEKENKLKIQNNQWKNANKAVSEKRCTILTNFLKNFIDACKKAYRTNPFSLFSATSLSRVAVLKMTGVELEYAIDD